MSSRIWKCTKCGKNSELIQRKEKINEEIEHSYFECQHCQHKETIFYSDKKLRKLIKKQAKEKNLIIKKGNEAIIKRRMAELRKQYS